MSIDALRPRIEAASDRGAVVLLKWDGQRMTNRCTVVVTYQPLDWVWRRDTDDIGAALWAALTEFEALVSSPSSSDAE